MDRQPVNGLFAILFDGLPVAPSQSLPDGSRSRGWTLREDRLNASLMRFDWIHGGRAYAGAADERAALRDDVLSAAERLARSAGFRVKPDGIGLIITAPKGARTRPGPQISDGR